MRLLKYGYGGVLLIFAVVKIIDRPLNYGSGGASGGHTTMQVHKIVQRNLSETEEETIRHFRYYYDNRRCFALIGDYAAAVLSDRNSGSLEKLKQEALDNISCVLNTPPDFNTYVMDDMYGLVEMNHGIYAVSPERLSDEELAAGKVNIATALAVRSSCLEACENGSIIAINDTAVNDTAVNDIAINDGE